MATQTTTTETRYAPYIEEEHKAFLSVLDAKVDNALAETPYAAYNYFAYSDYLFADDGLFDRYTALADDFDPKAYYNTVTADVVNSQTVRDIIQAEGQELSDNIETDALPRLMTGARDMNAVMSSSFIIARSNLEAWRLKALSKFSAQMKGIMLDNARQIWQTLLTWKQNNYEMYRNLTGFYMTTLQSFEQQHMDVRVKESMWDLSVLEYHKSGIGAMQGAFVSSTDAPGIEPGITEAIGKTMAGAAIGSLLGPPGMLIGAVLGASTSEYVGEKLDKIF